MAISPNGIDADLVRCGFRRLPPLGPLPTLQAVESAARAAECSLPLDYSDFCARFGAGTFDHTVMLPLPPGCVLGPELPVDQLFGVGGDPNRDPLALVADRYEDCLPPGAIPIGTDPVGNLVLLGCGPLVGVFVWDHQHRELKHGQRERRIDDLRYAGIDVSLFDTDHQLLWLWDESFPDRVHNPTGYGNLYRLADSFTEMCAALLVRT